MARLIWHEPDTTQYEAGVDRCVFYPEDKLGIPWNGIISIEENVNAESNKLYLDGVNIRDRKVTNGFSATLEAFTYPDEFMEYDGYSEGLIAQQQRKEFNLAYRTGLGNNLKGLEYGYRIHLVYNAVASPTVKDYSSISDEVDPSTFSWGLSTRPIFVDGAKASAHVIIDSTQTHAWTMAALEDILYGNSDGVAQFPSLDVIFELFQDNSILKIVNHGDGTWTAEGPEEIIRMLDATTFEIETSAAVYLDFQTYTIQSQ